MPRREKRTCAQCLKPFAEHKVDEEFGADFCSGECRAAYDEEEIERAHAPRVIVNARHTSKHAEHYTPPKVIDAARRVMGAIDLDPASSARANRVVGAARIYTSEENGFEASWDQFLNPSRVFLNPPGGKQDAHGVRVEKGDVGRGAASAQKAWWFKLAREWVGGRVHQAVFVGFSIEILQTTQVEVPDQRGIRLPIPLDFPLCFPSRRLAYWVEKNDELVEGKSPPHASVLIYLPPRAPAAAYGIGVAKFVHEFSSLGRVVRPLASSVLDREVSE